MFLRESASEVAGLVRGWCAAGVRRGGGLCLVLAISCAKRFFVKTAEDEILGITVKKESNMNSASLKLILAATLGALAPEAKVLFDSQMKPFLDKEIDALTGGDWHDIAKIAEAAFIQAGDVELAKAAVKIAQVAGASA